MAPRLPERYQTQVRLGRDNDVEEWLAIDTTLDRPVLVRVLSSEASPTRRTTFLERNRLAASAGVIRFETQTDFQREARIAGGLFVLFLLLAVWGTGRKAR